MKSEIEIISLDLDGVLYDGLYAAVAVGQELGLGSKFDDLFRRIAAEKMNHHESIIEGSKVWIGIPVDGPYQELIDSIPLMKGAKETVALLKKTGFEVGCISSGVSQFFMKPFSKRLHLDFAYSNILGETDGKHDGTTQYVMGGPQKAETILKHVEDRGLSQSNIASVGNGTNDIELFTVSALSIAFNPLHVSVSDTASVTVESKDLRSILPYFEKS
ncbi:MAG: HAD family hydrolase [Candidatus Thorarchaeota archaeon]